MGGLIRYLMGPGRFNEHTDPRVIAAWDGAPELHQPRPLPDAGGFDCDEVAADLTDPQVAAGIPQHEPAAGPDGKTRRGPVWHCSLRNHTDDRVLSDSEWAEIAAEVMDRTGIAARGDLGACRWVAVRHADDHIHIAAVLVRQDGGGQVHPPFDFRRVREVCQEVEERLGLMVTGDADRTAPRQPTRPEQEKADRRNEPATSREQLQHAARLAAVRAQSLLAFLADLEDRGVLTRTHRDATGEVDGYSLAVAGDVDVDGQAVWYSGRALGRDLALPRLLEQWASAPPPPPPIPRAEGERTRVGRSERSAALEQATSAVENATERLAGGDYRDADGTAHATRDLLAAFADIAAGPYPELSAVASQYDRAARVPRDVLPRELGDTARALRTAAWRLAAVGGLPRRGRDAGAAGALLVALAALAVEVSAYQATRSRLVQSRSAGRCADRLRAASPGRPPRDPRASAGTGAPSPGPGRAGGRSASPAAGPGSERRRAPREGGRNR